MAKSSERIRALALRRQGESIKAIAHTLGVSRGSVSVWVRDIVLTQTQRNVLQDRQIRAGHAGRMLGAAMNKAKKEKSIQLAQADALKRIRTFSARELYGIGIGLYWGEGVKASNGIVAVVNSDPRVILFMMRWFTECWGVERSRFRPRISISDSHKDRERVLLAYWSKILGIPGTQFARVTFLGNRKKVYENRDVYYGVLTLRVARGAELRHRILADLERVCHLAGVVQELERGTHKP